MSDDQGAPWLFSNLRHVSQSFSLLLLLMLDLEPSRTPWLDALFRQRSSNIKRMTFPCHDSSPSASMCALQCPYGIHRLLKQGHRVHVCSLEFSSAMRHMITIHSWMLSAIILTTISNLKQPWPMDSARIVKYSISACHVSFCTDGESKI